MNATKPASVRSKKMFIDAVRDSEELPGTLREHFGTASDVKETAFDESYIEFLDERIRLTPRGKAEQERLNKRRGDLSPFCGVRLVLGTIRAGETEFEVRVNPKTRCVVHWEALDDWATIKQRIKAGVLVNVLLHDSLMLGAKFIGFSQQSWNEVGRQSLRQMVSLQNAKGARFYLPSKAIRMIKSVEHPN